MSRCHPRFKTPHVSTVITGVFAALIAAVFPLDLLADLISIGILLAFAVVCIGVLVLRYTRPDEHRPFRVPWAPFTCVLGTLVCARHDLLPVEGHLDAPGDLDRASACRSTPSTVSATAACANDARRSTTHAGGGRLPHAGASSSRTPAAGCYGRSGPTTGATRRVPRSAPSPQVAPAIAQFEPVTVGRLARPFHRGARPAR